MPNGFDAFYAGNMAPPLQINGQLVPVPNILSPAQIYAGIIPTATAPKMDPVGPGMRPSGGYYQLADMLAGAGSPDRLAPSSPNVDLPGMGGVNPAVLAYGAPGKNYGTGAKVAVDNPGLAAIRTASPPVPRIAPTGAAWKDGWGARALQVLMFPSLPNGMPVDSDIPTNSRAFARRLPATPQLGAARSLPQPAPAPPRVPVGVAAIANAPAPAPTLNQIVYGQSHDFGPGYRPF